jgi:hypothetical protein
MKQRFFLLGLALGLACLSNANAHHSVAAQFDTNRNVAATGVLRKVEMVNPHAYMQFTVTDATGKIHEMRFETGAPLALKRAGLSIRDNLKVGDTFKLVYSPLRNGGIDTGLLWAFTLPDGKFVAFGSKQNIEAARALSK